MKESMEGTHGDNRYCVVDVASVVKSSICVSVDDGNKLNRIILDLLNEGCIVCLSFKGVQVLAPPFISSAICELHDKFDNCVIKRRLLLQQIRIDQLGMVRRAVDNERLYLKDPQAYEKAIKEVENY